MNDQKFFKISLVTTIIGLAGIMILSGYVTPEHVTIDKIDKSMMDNQVEVDAEIVSVTLTKTNTRIIRLKDSGGSINLVIFSSWDINYDLKTGQHVKVIARVSQYNNELELILEESKNIIIK